MGVERFPNASDHPESGCRHTDAALISVHLRLQHGIRVLPDRHRTGDDRLHLRPKYIVAGSTQGAVKT